MYSFEQKPLGSAFITVCRCENSEVADGKEALSDLYGMLSFHTEDFEAIGASSHLFTKSRVYNVWAISNTAETSTGISPLSA